MNLNCDLAIIGAGPAGLSVALEARKNGIENILILERDRYLGGILPQCIHNGFGLHYFREELTGPEYADRFISQIMWNHIEVKTETMVIKITPEKEIIALNPKDGLLNIRPRAIALAMGCRERTREAIRIPGSRPAGIFSAGTAQRYINIEGYIPGRKIVILGSGDIGMIMARRFALEGAKVKMVLEIMPYTTGLIRNKVQCLDDFNIPLRFNYTIVRIEGEKRVEKVVISRVDKNLIAIPNTEEIILCDTILFSVGLIPENELSLEMGIQLSPVTGGAIVNENRETGIKGIFACGNVLHVHDLVDFVSEEGEIVGRAVSKYLNQKTKYRSHTINLVPSNPISYVIPQHIDYIDSERKKIKLFMRVQKPIEKANIIFQDEKRNTIISYTKKMLTPGEMISLYLPEKLIQKDIKILNISIKEVNQE